MTEKAWTVASYCFYSAGSVCFLIGTVIALWRTIKS